MSQVKPSPPPAFRNVFTQPLPTPRPLTQADYPRLAPAESTKVSWSASLSPAPTATLYTTTNPSPEPETATVLREEHARLKRLLSQQTHHLNPLQAQITELKQLIAAHNASNLMQKLQPFIPALQTKQRSL